MGDKIRDVMTPNPITMPSSTTVLEAARTMRDSDIGDVLVESDGTLCGVVTDRDIVVRAIAEGFDPQATTLNEVCTHELVTVEPDATVAEAAQLMSDRAIRRLPVVDGGRPVGMVTIADLAVEGRDTDDTLAEISSAPPNN